MIKYSLQKYKDITPTFQLFSKKLKGELTYETGYIYKSEIEAFASVGIDGTSLTTTFNGYRSWMGNGWIYIADYKDVKPDSKSPGTGNSTGNSTNNILSKITDSQKKIILFVALIIFLLVVYKLMFSNKNGKQI